jgi:hypothetical protein
MEIKERDLGHVVSESVRQKSKASKASSRVEYGLIDIQRNEAFNSRWTPIYGFNHKITTYNGRKRQTEWKMVTLNLAVTFV